MNKYRVVEVVTRAGTHWELEVLTPIGAWESKYFYDSYDMAKAACDKSNEPMFVPIRKVVYP